MNILYVILCLLMFYKYNIKVEFFWNVREILILNIEKKKLFK